MKGEITIRNKSGRIVEIDIEGIIGVPEACQFEDPKERVATYDRFKARLEEIGGITSPEIIVNIRSTGGNVNDALLIYDLLSGSGATVTTRCYGYVASAATVIAQAASKGRREISANTLYLIHKSISAAEGNTHNMTQTIQLLDKTDERIAGIYAARSGKPIEGFAELMDSNNGNGRWLSAPEAIEISLADRIIGARPIANNAAELVRQLNLPELPEKTTQKDQPMTIKQQWNAIRNLLGLTSDKEEALTEPQLDKVDRELAERGEQAAGLQDRISELESENARLLAKVTATKCKEDPCAGDSRMSHNAQAYSDDIRNFR